MPSALQRAAARVFHEKLTAPDVFRSALYGRNVTVRDPQAFEALAGGYKVGLFYLTSAELVTGGVQGLGVESDAAAQNGYKGVIYPATTISFVGAPRYHMRRVAQGNPALRHLGSIRY